MMSPEVIKLLEEIGTQPLYYGVNFDDINATNSDGDNALHCVAIQGDVAAAVMLIDAGIEIDKRGDFGHTPLHEACSAGHADMVRLLLEKGADMYAQTEGATPFMIARECGQDHICDLLKPHMEQAQLSDPDSWIKVRIAHLRREIARLENSLVDKPEVP